MRRIVIAVILGIVTGLTATAALAAGPQVKKPRESKCLIAHSASSESVSCRSVLVGLAARVSDRATSNRLPYDEFGLAANQPSQPRIGGTAIPTTDLPSPNSAPKPASARTATAFPMTSSGSPRTSRASRRSVAPARRLELTERDAARSSPLAAVGRHPVAPRASTGGHLRAAQRAAHPEDHA